jgi:acyl carrier protein
MNTVMNEKLQEIFRVIFELPPHAEVAGLSQTNEEKWDSLAHVSLIAALETEFGIAVDAADALRMTSFRDAMILLEEKAV